MKNTKSEHILTSEDAAILHNFIARYRNMVQHAKKQAKRKNPEWDESNEEDWHQEMQRCKKLTRFVDNYTL